MSLLDEPTDLVLLFPEVDGEDEDGNPVRVPSTTPLALYCRVQPVTATETEAVAPQITTLYRLIARTFPTGTFARITWQGRDWDILGEPHRYGGSECTRHVSVMLRARSPQVEF